MVIRYRVKFKPSDRFQYPKRVRVHSIEPFAVVAVVYLAHKDKVNIDDLMVNFDMAS